MSIKFSDETAAMLSRNVIQKSPLEAMRKMLDEVDAGRIQLRRLELDTSAAASGKIEFVFRGEAIAVLSEGDL